jgi:hypothetical protein
VYSFYAPPSFPYDGKEGGEGRMRNGKEMELGEEGWDGMAKRGGEVNE